MDELLNCLNILLLNRTERLDRFDASYIDDFHFILAENYDITNCGKSSNTAFNKLIEILKIECGKELDENISLREVTTLLQGLNFDKSKYLPHISSDKTCKKHKYNTISNWDKLKSEQTVKSKLEIQRLYSLQSGGNRNVSDPKIHFEARFSKYQNQLFNTFPKNFHILSVGNRWKGEIEFIRKKFNLPNTYGLDLFSEDINYVKIGDIHNTKFEDNTYDVVYQKNTFNKLYDLRKALNECIRILKPNGILISNDCYDYSVGVNPLARTSVTNNKWYFLYLKDKIDIILLDIEQPIQNSWLRNSGLFAVKIKK